MFLATQSDESGISHAEVLTRSRRLAEAVAPNARKAEALRRMPPENVEAMLESGLDMLYAPKRFGGYGCSDWMLLVDVVAEVGKVCGSSAWCLAFLIQHHWPLTLFAEAAQVEAYEIDPRPKVVSSFIPSGTFTPTEDGGLLEGEWANGSGGDHCNFAIVGTMVPPSDAAGRPEPHWILLHPGDFTIRDVWRSVGLKGSGTNNIVVPQVRIPKARMLRVADFAAGRTPGGAVHDGVIYRQPGFSAFPFGLMAPLFAIAKGAYGAFVEMTATRVSLMSGQKVAGSSIVHVGVGEAAAEIDAAYLLMMRISQTLTTALPLDETAQLAIRRDFIFASRLLLRAVDRLFDMSGSSGLSENNTMERFWRDAHAAARHGVFNVHAAYEGFGRHAFGLSPASERR